MFEDKTHIIVEAEYKVREGGEEDGSEEEFRTQEPQDHSCQHGRRHAGAGETSSLPHRFFIKPSSGWPQHDRGIHATLSMVAKSEKGTETTSSKHRTGGAAHHVNPLRVYPSRCLESLCPLRATSYEGFKKRSLDGAINAIHR